MIIINLIKNLIGLLFCLLAGVLIYIGAFFLDDETAGRVSDILVEAFNR